MVQSAGMCNAQRIYRQFVKELLPKFQDMTPVTIEEVVTRGRHPYWQAEYGACTGQCTGHSPPPKVTGNQRTVGLRKADPAEVLRQGMLLRSAVGTHHTTSGVMHNAALQGGAPTSPSRSASRRST